MSALFNTRDQLILENDAAPEEYVFYVAIQTQHGHFTFRLAAHADYSHPVPRYRLHAGQQREVGTAISHFIPTIDGRKDYIIPPFTGMFLSDGHCDNRVTQFAHMYVQWRDFGTIPIGTLREFEITCSSILDEHARRALLNIAS